MLKVEGLLLFMIGTVFCADLPTAAQRELDSFNAAVAKADAVRQAAVNAAVDKAVKALNTVAKNADTAEERRAKWEYKKQENVIHVSGIENGGWDDIVLPLDPKGTKVNNHYYGPGRGLAVKDTK